MWYLRPGHLLDVFIRSVFAGLRRAAVREGIADAQCGAITAKGGQLTPPEGGSGPEYTLT